MKKFTVKTHQVEVRKAFLQLIEENYDGKEPSIKVFSVSELRQGNPSGFEFEVEIG
jgi:hypothetical protein